VISARQFKTSRRWLFLSFLLIYFVTGCFTSNESTSFEGATTTTKAPQETAGEPPSPTIAVTYSVLAALVSDLVGNLANVVSVIPDGEDPHIYQPTESELQVIRDSDFVVANGLHFEAGLDGVLEEVRRDGKQIFYLIDHVTARFANDEAHSHDHDDGHNHGPVDLHLWMSPPTMRQMIPELSLRLGELLGSDLQPSAERLVNELDELDTEIFRDLSNLENCTILVNHDEFGYFSERYGCVSSSVSIPATAEEVNDTVATTIREAVQSAGVRAVFTNRMLSPELVEQITAATDTKVVFVRTHSMGPSTRYTEFVQSIVDTIVSALAD